MRSRRVRHDALLRLIEQAYAAAETRLWDPFLLSLAESVNGRDALLLQHDAAVSGSIDIGVCADLRRPEYLSALAVQRDPTRLLTVVVEQGHGTTSVLIVLRGECDAPFEPRDRQVVAAVVPHVQRALQIHQRISQAQREHATAIVALDAAPCAVFLVTANARVVVANRRGAAMQVANDGLSSERSRLQGVYRRETKRLRDLCAAVSVRRPGQPPHPGGVVALTGRLLERRALQVIVVPALDLEAPGSHDRDVTAVVFVSDPSNARGPSEALLRQRYGLTVAESQVAARIAIGWSLAEIAAERGRAIETVRRQNKQILAKTGTRHRSELVHLLSTTVLTTAESASRSRF